MTSGRNCMSLWRLLAAAGREAIAEALTKKDFERLNIESGINLFLVQQVLAGRSVVVTGNAGDGKTHLLRRAKSELERAGAVVVEDATAEMQNGDPNYILKKWRKAIKEGKPFCIAANEYPLYQLRMEGKSDPHIVEVSKQCEGRLTYREDGNSNDTSNVVVIDLSLRNPLGREFFNSMLDRLLNDEEIKAAMENPEAKVAKFNIERLKHPQVRERLIKLMDRMVAIGHRATVRELWILLARMVVGTDNPDSNLRKNWYSEALFDRDDRFDLTEALQAVDPAGCSHPVWDAALDVREHEVLNGWLLEEPVMPPHPNLEWEDFASLKRRFYFEHKQGDESFDLEDEDAKKFEDLLQNQERSSRAQVADLVGAINAAYCPCNFDSRDLHLYLWHGHRFHEQPTRSFVAAKRVSTDDLVLELPRLPKRLENCFDYRPDHITLTTRQHQEKLRLRIDFPLWQTLRRLERGLPRKLVPERDIHRLDAFLQNLGQQSEADSYDDGCTVWSVHLENSEIIQVDLSTDRKRYERIRRHG